MAAYKEQYYSLSETEMQDLLEKAKSGSEKSQLELLKVFNNFLTKYTTMLYVGKYSLKDYDIRRFISLFVKDNFARIKLSRNKIDSATMKVVNEAMNGINYMIKRYCDERDVRQTVEMTFFQCVKRYQRKDSEKGPIPFSAFLYSYFFYLLKKNVDLFLIDQLGRKSFPLIDNDDYEEEESGEKQVGFRPPPVEVNMDLIISTEPIDEMWVLGTTASEPFLQLTIQERQLLKWRYGDGKKSSEIADKTTEHANTVREHIGKIKDKIRDTIKQSNMEEYLWYIRE